MNRIALTLATLGTLVLGAERASASDQGRQRTTAAMVIGNAAVHHSGQMSAANYYEVSQRYSSRRSHQRYPEPSYRSRGCGSSRGYGGYGAMIVQPRAYGHPTVVVPRMSYPSVYRSYGHGYSYPRSGFQYQGRGFSFGFGF